MTFQKLPPKANFPDIEKEIIKKWKEENTFKKSIETRSVDNAYTFYDGPPFATGLPHHGHLLISTVKDIVARYQTMKGKRVDRVWGWDCHGLPIEYEKEKELGLRGKEDIEAMGVDKFNESCRSTILKYADVWKEVIERLGRWVDMENDYKTMEPWFMESIWWVFSKLWEKGLIYEGYKPMHICPRCATPLANFEVSQGYKDVQDLSATVKFKVLDKEIHGFALDKPTYILAWTTTPWTLPGNVALAVNPKEQYVVIENLEKSEYYILAKKLASKYFESIIADGTGHLYLQGILAPEGEKIPDQKIRIINQDIVGHELKGLHYSPLFPNIKPEKEGNKYIVVASDFVTMNDGTGVLHVAPAFGSEDYQIGKDEDLAFVQHINIEGVVKDYVGEKFAGKVVKTKDDPRAFDKEICDHLEDEDLLFKKETYNHSYPHCWRCDTPLLNFAFSTWFMKIEGAVKEKMLEKNKEIKWVPDFAGSARFANWIENAPDWALSRNRYWGTPLPIWKGFDKSGEVKDIVCFGSKQELEDKIGVKLEDIHKHFIDQYTWEENGLTYKRVDEVFDCWFESGAMPYASFHYPFEKKDYFDHNFPAEFIAEAMDQTRGWFYTLLVESVGLFENLPAKNIVVMGLLLASDGKKLSKSKKNYTDPTLLFDQKGADAFRFTLINSPVVKGENAKFTDETIDEKFKTIILPFWNALSFFTTYASIDKWEVKEFDFKVSNPLDRWILSETQELIKNVTTELDGYDLQKASDEFGPFLDKLNNWYIRRSRRRFWKSENDGDKLEAYGTLHYVLSTFNKLLAPFCPFITEYAYGVLNSGNESAYESVHLDFIPEVNKKLIDKELETITNTARNIVSLGFTIRARESVKIRQPLAVASVAIGNKKLLKEIEAQESIIKEELNVKDIKWTKDAETIATVSVSPNAKILGPKYGSKMQDIIKAAKNGEYKDLGEGKLEVLGFVLEPTDYEWRYEAKGNLKAQGAGEVLVGLDTEITEELKQEGSMRDLIREVQEARKEANFDISDRITLGIDLAKFNFSENLISILSSEVLANEISCSLEKPDFEKEIEIDGSKFKIQLKKNI